MKKILYALISVIAVASMMLSLAACTEECKHIDADDDYICDNCGEEFEDGIETATVKFTVQVIDGAKAAGAKFTLTKGKTEKTFTAGADGTVSGEIEVGKYTVSVDTESLPQNCLGVTETIEIKRDSTAFTIELVDNTPDGTEEKPFFLSEKKNTVEIPAGAEYYYSFHGTSDAHLEVRGDNIVVTLGENTYTPEASVVIVNFTDSFATSVKFSVKNNNSEAKSIGIELVSPLGSYDNPIELTTATKDVPVEKGASIHYKWVANKSGMLVLTSANPKNNIGMTNITTQAVAAQTYGDKGAYLPVNAGDEIIIAVSSTTNEDTEIDLALNIYAGTESDPVPVIKDSIDVSLAAGASFTFNYSFSDTKELYISNSDVTVTVNGDTKTPSSLGIVRVDLTGSGIVTVTNTSDEKNGVDVEFNNK